MWSRRSLTSAGRLEQPVEVQVELYGSVGDGPPTPIFLHKVLAAWPEVLAVETSGVGRGREIA
jgi:hypothetical protein